MSQKVYVGIDLGGTMIKMGLCSTEGEIIQEVEQPTPKGSYQEVLQSFKLLLADQLKQTKLSTDHVMGVGVGVPALLDVKKGFVHEVVNLGWRDVPLKDELERVLDLPCYIDNDANCAALGEMWQGAGKGSSHLICITIGTGIGGGLILNGDIYHGALGLAGEIGHLTVRAEDGRRCNCGKVGCLETETSATAIAYYGNRAIELGKETQLRMRPESSGNITAKDVFDAARNGDQVCHHILNQVSYYLGLTLAQVSNVLNPEKIVVGGGVSKAGSFFLDPVREQFRQHALKQVAEIAEILPAQLGNSAGWLGAAWLVHRNSEH